MLNVIVLQGWKVVKMHMRPIFQINGRYLPHSSSNEHTLYTIWKKTTVGPHLLFLEVRKDTQGLTFESGWVKVTVKGEVE